MDRSLLRAAVIAGIAVCGAGTIRHVAVAGWQPPADRVRVTCMSLLSDAAVESTMGRRGASADKSELDPGASRCTWTWAETETTVTVSYSDAGAIAASAALTKCCPAASKPAVAQFFDHAIRMAVDLGAEPPAALTGLGERAALFFEEGFLKLLVQRTDGVAQIVGGNVTREQLLALGRLVANPQPRPVP
jgi:hypothetical protein